VVEHSRGDIQIGMDRQNVSRLKVLGDNPRAANIQRRRKPGRAHEFAENFPCGFLAGEMARPDANRIFPVEKGFEIRKSHDVVIVAVGEEHVDRADTLSLERLASWQQSGTRIEQENMLAASDFDADRVATIFPEFVS
jgi:hypothetical protein